MFGFQNIICKVAIQMRWMQTDALNVVLIEIRMQVTNVPSVYYRIQSNMGFWHLFSLLIQIWVLTSRKANTFVIFERKVFQTICDPKFLAQI
jgi:hypothetical protein